MGQARKHALVKKCRPESAANLYRTNSARRFATVCIFGDHDDWAVRDGPETTPVRVHPLFFLRVPFYCLRTFSFSFALPRRNSDAGVGKQLLSPPPHYGTRLRVHREQDSALSFLVDSRRIVLSHAIQRSRQLVSRR